MTPHYFSIKETSTVKEALEKIQAIGNEKETIYYCYVTDREREFSVVLFH